MTANHRGVDKICLVTGVGPGKGTALVDRFLSGGCRAAMLARNEERLKTLSSARDDAHAYRCDVSDAAALAEMHDRIRSELGVPTVVLHNAVGGAFGSFREIDPEVLQRNFQVNTIWPSFISRASSSTT